MSHLKMPLLAVSPNIHQDDTKLPELSSRKRSHQDYVGKDLSGDNGKNGMPLHVAGTENTSTSSQQQPSSPSHHAATVGTATMAVAAATKTDMSSRASSPLSVLSDVGTATPPRPSPSPETKREKAVPSSATAIDSTSTSTAQPPPAKRKRLTQEEKEEKAKAEAARKAEKEKAEAARKEEKEKAEAARRQEKEEQRAAAEAEKRARNEERERRRKQKEEEERRRTDEKERKRREKEEEERKVQEAREKKERSQLKLNSFFKTGGGGGSTASLNTLKKGSLDDFSAAAGGKSPSRSPEKASRRVTMVTATKTTTTASSSAQQSALSEYDKMFKPFFIKENVIMATTLYGMDQETKEAKSRILDEYLSGARGEFQPAKFTGEVADAEYFHVPFLASGSSSNRSNHSHRRRRRGRTYPSMKQLMETIMAAGQDPVASARAQEVLEQLKTIPVKFLGYCEDVRPAYVGTITSSSDRDNYSSKDLAKLARNPLAKTVLQLNYDYDSEAEWVDDDGEDVDDIDEEEEGGDLEEDEEMADFLDDSEDAMPVRPAFIGGIEPESTGICWEGEDVGRYEEEREEGVRSKGQINLGGPPISAFRMEFILDHEGPLDPFSTQYWQAASPEPGPVISATGASNGSKKNNAKSATATMAPPPVPTDAFAVLGSATATATSVVTSSGGGSASKGDAKKLSGGSGGSGNGIGNSGNGIAAELKEDFKKAILQYAKLSKIGLVEILNVEFPKCTKSQIKVSLEAMAERTGAGQQKTWKLKGSSG